MKADSPAANPFSHCQTETTNLARFIQFALIAALLTFGARAGRIEVGPEKSAAFSMAPRASACIVTLPAEYGMVSAVIHKDSRDDPEPPIAMLLGTGLVGLGLVARRLKVLR